MGLTVRDLMSLEHSFRVQSESLSYAMWVLSGLLGFIRIQGFSPSDPALFSQLVTALSKSLAHQAHVAASHTAYACHKRREFYLSLLPAYFTDSTSAPSCQLRRSLRISSSVRRTLASCWTRRVRLCPSVHNRPCWTWYLAAPLLRLDLAVLALTALLALPHAGAVNHLDLPPAQISRFVLIRRPLSQL